jgi:replication factor A1
MLTYNFVLLTPCFCCHCSGASLKVVLWGERANSFLAEETHKNSQTSPQIVIFVGTLVKSYGLLSLTRSSSCKWYINPQVKEAKQLMVK